MTADVYIAKCNKTGTTADAHGDLTYLLPTSAVLEGLPNHLTGELFPGVDAEAGNPLAAKPCRLVVSGLTCPTVVQARDHNDRVVAVKEVRHSPSVTLPLAMLREVISLSDLKLELRPIIPVQRAG